MAMERARTNSLITILSYLFKIIFIFILLKKLNEMRRGRAGRGTMQISHANPPHPVWFNFFLKI